MNELEKDAEMDSYGEAKMYASIPKNLIRQKAEDASEHFVSKTSVDDEAREGLKQLYKAHFYEHIRSLLD